MIREFIQLHREFGQVALVPDTMKMSKYGKIAVAAKPNGDKSRKFKASKSKRSRGAVSSAR